MVSFCFFSPSRRALEVFFFSRLVRTLTFPFVSAQPTLKDIKAKNAQFAATARENAGKPRIRTSTSEDSLEAKQAAAKRGRTNVRPSREQRMQQKPVGGALSNKWALGLVVFVVCGGGE